MIRILLWLAVIYFLLRLVKFLIYFIQRPTKKEEGPLPPFSNVDDAEFEDLSEPPPPPSKE